VGRQKKTSFIDWISSRIDKALSFTLMVRGENGLSMVDKWDVDDATPTKLETAIMDTAGNFAENGAEPGTVSRFTVFALQSNGKTQYSFTVSPEWGADTGPANGSLKGTVGVLLRHLDKAHARILAMSENQSKQAIALAESQSATIERLLGDKIAMIEAFQGALDHKAERDAYIAEAERSSDRKDHLLAEAIGLVQRQVGKEKPKDGVESEIVNLLRTFEPKQAAAMSKHMTPEQKTGFAQLITKYGG